MERHFGHIEVKYGGNSPNPVPSTAEHVLALDEVDRAPSLGLVRDTADYYRVKRARGDEIIQEVRDGVEPWRKVAAAAGIARGEIEIMENAFSVT